MNSTQSLNLLTGWSTGYTYSREKTREDEIKQGKNYYLSACAQCSQSAHLANIIHKINESLPQHSLKVPIRILCNIVPLAICLPSYLFFAVVKHGHYETFARICNR